MKSECFVILVYFQKLALLIICKIKHGDFNEHKGERSISTMLVLFVLYVDRHTFKQWNTVFFLMLQLCFSCTDCEKWEVSNSVIFYFVID